MSMSCQILIFFLIQLKNISSYIEESIFALRFICFRKLFRFAPDAISTVGMLKPFVPSRGTIFLYFERVERFFSGEQIGADERYQRAAIFLLAN